jgi:hypothetical protein
MATTESSAIARLVDAAQNRGMPGPDSIFEPVDTQPVPSQHSSRPPGKASGGGPWWLLFVAVVVIGGSVVGGYVLAQQQGENESVSTEVAERGAAAVAAANAGQFVPDEVAASIVMPPIPTPVAESDAAAPEEVEEQLEPELGAKELELAAKTGFDILVEPKGAKVTLDGHAIGGAPLRVRNLLPGPHQIDIEGPEGYFGQHREFALDAGEAMVLRLALDPLGTAVRAPISEVADKAARDKPAPEKTAPEKTLSRSERRKAKREARRKTSAVAGKRDQAPSASEENDLARADRVSLGTLMLGAKPPCEIIINGKKTGLSTPQRAIQLPEGTHRVVLVNGEYGIRKSFKVRIKSGRTTRAIQDLTKKL